MSSAIAVQVDRRALWPAVRQQGARPSCLACATSDAHQACRSAPQAFSAEYLFHFAAQRMPRKDASGGLSFGAVHEALGSDGQPAETEWPYAVTQPDPWLPPSVVQTWKGSTHVRGVTSINDIVSVVGTGEILVLGLRLTAQWLDVLPAPYLISPTGPGFGGHAVLAVGLGETPGAGPLLLVRNSWGSSWGDQGYAWLPADYLRDKLIGCRRVDPKND